MSLVSLLETTVHSHARNVRRYRQLEIEPLDEHAIDVVKKYVGKLRKLTVEMNSILNSISEDAVRSMDQDSLSRLDMLTFYIHEVALNEEEEVLRTLLSLQNRLGIEIVSYKDFEYVKMAKDLAKRINTLTQLLLK
jgi:hypothetical protein